MKNKYPIEIFFSHEDEGYIALAPDLPGCSAFGETEEEALAEIKNAIALWVETAEKEGKGIPDPSNQTLLEKIMTGQRARVT
ncbi:MAG: type II toxin-antitoxin system HicB family antitoxin [Methanospirillaceae archaeon]|nr:type II toxin-antitoxin system HicB family antitoxin [Methanospirillaceae archaeon]